jgi:hypothetical protein
MIVKWVVVAHAVEEDEDKEASPDPWAPRVQMAHRDQPAHSDQLESKAFRDPLDQLESKEFREAPDQLTFRESKVPPAQLE